MTEPTTEAIRDALRTVSTGGALTPEAAEGFMAAVLDGQVTPAQLGGVLVGMHARGETAGELAGFVRAMRSRALAVEAPAGTIDTCGTGGDVRGTFNISTAVALVVAAAGVPVAKAGNRAVSSQAGSSDVMAALGLRVEQTPRGGRGVFAQGRLRLPARARPSTRACGTPGRCARSWACARPST